MERIKIAVVDTGINAKHLYFKDHIKEIYEYRSDKGKVIRVENRDICNDQNGHGTICTSAILSENKNIDIYSFKMMDEEGVGNLRGLEEILSFLCDMDIDIINMSLAIENNVPLTDLEHILTCLERQGKFLVAALENRKKESYPASFPQCFGCRGFIVESRGGLWFNDKKKIQCVVDSTPLLECDLGQGYTMVGKSNSFATARLTGILSKIMFEEKQWDRKQIERRLCEMSCRTEWNDDDFFVSKRFPELEMYKESSPNLVEKVENVVRHYLKLERSVPLSGQGLFSGEIGLRYEDCFQLLQMLQKEIDFQIGDYTKVSREDFYTVNHICNLIQCSKN